MDLILLARAFRPSKSLVIALATLAFAVQVGSLLADEQTWDYRGYLAEGRFSEAETLIRMKLRGKQTPAEFRWRLLVDQAKSQRFQGKFQDAIRALTSIDKSESIRDAVRTELAWCYVLSNRAGEAVGLLEAVRSGSDGEAKCQALYLLARVAFEEKAFQRCIDQCKAGLAELRRVDLYHNPYAWELRSVDAQLKQLLAEAQDQVIEERFGSDYANYRRGRIAQQRGQYEDAIRYYRKIKAPVLVDAAGCYVGQCLASLGALAEASEHWQQFVKADEFDLYRGEAMLGLGRMYLQHAQTRDHLQQAETWLRRAVEWHEQVDRETPPATVESIKELLKSFPLPADLAARDRFGNFHRNHVGPETIVNRMTAKWYMGNLGLQAALYHAFALHELSDKQAKQALDRVLTANSAAGGALLDPGDFPDLLVRDAADGAFLLPPAVWGALPVEYAVRLHLGCYLLTAGDIQQAGQYFRAVQREVQGQASKMLVWSAAELGLACAEFRGGDHSAALDRLNRFEAGLRESPMTPMAILLAANVYAGQRNGWEDARQRYVWVAKQVSGSSLAARALLSMAIAAINVGDQDTARQAMQALAKEYPDSIYTRAAAVAMPTRRSVSRVEKSTNSGKHDAQGQLVRFERNLVLPGVVDLRVDLTQFGSTDVLDYFISYTIRTGCRMPTVRFESSLFEPQPLPATQSPLTFLRVPALALFE